MLIRVLIVMLWYFIARILFYFCMFYAAIVIVPEFGVLLSWDTCGLILCCHLKWILCTTIIVCYLQSRFLTYFLTNIFVAVERMVLLLVLKLQWWTIYMMFGFVYMQREPDILAWSSWIMHQWYTSYIYINQTFYQKYKQ